MDFFVNRVFFEGLMAIFERRFIDFLLKIQLCHGIKGINVHLAIFFTVRNSPIIINLRQVIAVILLDGIGKMLDFLPRILGFIGPLDGRQEDLNVKRIFQHRVEAVDPFRQQNHLFAHGAAQTIKRVFKFDIQFLGRGIRPHIKADLFFGQAIWMGQEDKEHFLGGMHLPVAGGDQDVLQPDFFLAKGLDPQLMRGINQVFVRQHFDEVFNHLRIKVGAGLRNDQIQGFLFAQSPPIRPV